MEQKLIVAQLVRWFITVFATRHYPQPDESSTHLYKLPSILTSSHLRLGRLHGLS